MKDGERYKNVTGSWSVFRHGETNMKPWIDIDGGVNDSTIKFKSSKTRQKTYSEKLLDPRWQKKRLEILQRDEFTCRRCGDNESTLHIHHLAYSKDPWDVDSKLLITLCENCHEFESSDFKKESVELIKDLKLSGFSSLSLYSLRRVFMDTDRGWTFCEPSFDVIKMIIDDDKLWQQMEDIFWSRLSTKHKVKDELKSDHDEVMLLMKNEDNSPYASDYIP